MRSSNVIWMFFSILEFTAKNGDFMPFFAELIGKTITRSRGSIIQLVCAFEYKDEFHIFGLKIILG